MGSSPTPASTPVCPSGVQPVAHEPPPGSLEVTGLKPSGGDRNPSYPSRVRPDPAPEGILSQPTRDRHQKASEGPRCTSLISWSEPVQWAQVRVPKSQSQLSVTVSSSFNFCGPQFLYLYHLSIILKALWSFDLEGCYQHQIGEKIQTVKPIPCEWGYYHCTFVCGESPIACP